jgi:hypothetical protein
VKVLNIATKDFGGAGIATLLIHQELKGTGFDSTLLVKNKSVNDHTILEWGQLTFKGKLYAKYDAIVKRLTLNFINNQFLFFGLFDRANQKKYR